MQENHFNRVTLETDKKNSALPGITSLMKRFNVVDLLHRLFIRSFSNQAHPIT